MPVQHPPSLSIRRPPTALVALLLSLLLGLALPAAASDLLGGGPRSSDLLGGPTITGAVGPPLPEAEAFQVELAAESAGRLLLRFRIAPGYYVYRDKIRVAVERPAGLAVAVESWPPARTHSDPFFGEQAVYFDEATLPLALTPATGGTQAVLRVDFMACQDGGICYPPLQRTLAVDLPAAPAAPATRGLLLALGFALLGGLILNLMPCVLPILSLKALSLAGSPGPAASRRTALGYTAGVVVGFSALGVFALVLRELGLVLGWGFQLQQPAVVAGLALLMLAIGLALSGLFTLGAGAAGLGDALARRSGSTGDFFTGLLAVVVAAPCTAPFMGVALAHAFTAPPMAGFAVFVALGLGLALPFLLIGFVPALARRLPRPGAWMETFKQALAFPMYLTAAWLAWVLAQQRGADAVGWLLGGAVLLAFGLWAGERLRFRAAGWRLLAAAPLLAGLAVLGPIHRLPAEAPATTTAPSRPAADGSEPWSAARLAALRAEGRPVFVNMSADWCITCKANERTVLASARFHAALRETGAAYLKGDWTSVDPAITAYLQGHGAAGVPFYAVYPADGGPPRRLPELLSPGLVEQALHEAARQATSPGGTTR
ncbi:MAG: thioredoxin family protein [Xanthomonadaceae bacterium]|jgi:thiol:disulfide interchange protein DsbD|nr:thioredoxin family protein [Xanthomonadaceae bacterium]